MSLVVKSFEMLTITKEILPTTKDQRPTTKDQRPTTLSVVINYPNCSPAPS
jgi:hypothetical protein